VGARVGGRRRAAGLRREELAELAGISVDYLTRLEQGRATSPSTQVVESLSRALRLSDVEREHLFRLAGQTPPGLDVVSSRVTPSVQRLLDRLANTPVAVHDATWTLIVANAPYDALMGDTTRWRGIERNGVWRNLVGPGTRAVHTPQEQAEFEAIFHFITDEEGPAGIVATLRDALAPGSYLALSHATGDFRTQAAAKAAFRGVLIQDNGDRTRRLAALLADGTLRPVVRHVLPLAAAADAHRIVESGHAGGEIGLEVTGAS
jgi:transcriptional regulator with XRE-family HTH domain